MIIETMVIETIKFRSFSKNYCWLSNFYPYVNTDKEFDYSNSRSFI